MTADAALSAPVLFYAAVLVLAAWGALMALRGDFWRAEQRLVEGEFQPDRWPTIAVVVPARNEADVIEEALLSISGQDYEGDIRVFLVDDRSDDETAHLARRVPGVTVVSASDTPPGWTGKLWAVSQGLAAAEEAGVPAEYFWLTDADIAHHPGELASLVAGSEHSGLDLNSLMVRLRIDRLWDVLLIPAFVFFFRSFIRFRG